MDIKKYIKNSIDTKNAILHNDAIIEKINKIAEEIIKAYQSNNKILLAGNGGSAADAQHIAAELVSKFFINRLGLSAFALSTNSSVITSVSNDYGYEQVFARQIQAHSRKGDVFIGISTSGTSQNIILALEEAKKNNLITVGLFGDKSVKAEKYCDYFINVPSDCTPIIQESHIMLGHIICALVEDKLFSERK
ncbi:SIS domain-containing protein [bacterium]|nr:SIS domain-containing protein [bacterium]